MTVRAAPRIVAFYSDSAAMGGAEKVMLDLAAGLDRKVWNPVLLFHQFPQLQRLREAALAQDIPYFVVGSLNAISSPLRTIELVRLLRRIKPDVLHVHLSWPGGCTEALIAAQLADVAASIATLHLYQEPSGLRSKLRQSIADASVSSYVVVSQNLGRRLQQTFGVAEDRINVIPNGTRITNDLPIQRERLRPPVQGVPEGSQIVLTVGRLEAQKGHRYMIEAALNNTQATFLFAGDGSQRNALSTLIAGNGLADRVLLLGYRDDIPRLLAASDLFVLPSIDEGMPLVILEAMSAGIPVIATNVGGNPELIESGHTGWLVPPADSAALSSAITLALSNARLRSTVAECARNLVAERYSIEQSVAATAAHYENFLALMNVQKTAMPRRSIGPRRAKAK